MPELKFIMLGFWLYELVLDFIYCYCFCFCTKSWNSSLCVCSFTNLSQKLALLDSSCLTLAALFFLLNCLLLVERTEEAKSVLLFMFKGFEFWEKYVASFLAGGEGVSSVIIKSLLQMYPAEGGC